MSFSRPIIWCHSHANLIWPVPLTPLIVVDIQVGEDFEVPPAGLFRLNLQADYLKSPIFCVVSKRANYKHCILRVKSYVNYGARSPRFIWAPV